LSTWQRFRASGLERQMPANHASMPNPSVRKQLLAGQDFAEKEAWHHVDTEYRA
jgi:hypothetical protein